jgi:hypothetical protein
MADLTQHRANATKQDNSREERSLAGDLPATDNRDADYDARSHKSISRLPDSPESRQQVYRWLEAWDGMSHE